MSAAACADRVAEKAGGRAEPPGPPSASPGNGGASGPPPGPFAAAWIAFILTYLALMVAFRQG